MLTLTQTIRKSASAALFVGAVAGMLRLLTRPPVSRYVVDGPSMEPTYRPGDRLLVNRLAYRKHPPRTGDVVVLRDPERRGHLLLKRVAPAPAGSPPATIYVLGDNSEESRDSRAFATVPATSVIGKAWLRY